MNKGFAVIEKPKKLISHSLTKNGTLENNFEEVFKRACNTKYTYVYMAKISPVKLNNFMVDPYGVNFIKSISIRRYLLSPSLYKSLKHNESIIQKYVYMDWLENLWISGQEVKCVDEILEGNYRGLLVFLDVNKMHDTLDPIKKNNLKKDATFYIQIGNKPGKESYSKLD